MERIPILGNPGDHFAPPIGYMKLTDLALGDLTAYLANGVEYHLGFTISCPPGGGPKLRAVWLAPDPASPRTPIARAEAPPTSPISVDMRQVIREAWAASHPTPTDAPGKEQSDDLIKPPEADDPCGCTC